MELSIVILNWNVAEMLAACLRALPEACGGWWERTEVIVVDNGSVDGSVEMVRGEFPGVRVIALGENRGFTRGNNVGIRAARGRYVLVLNPDTVAHGGSIAKLCEYMEGHREVGIAGPRLVNGDGSTQSSRRRFPTVWTALVEFTPLQRYLGGAGVLRRFYVEDRGDDEEQYVDWVSGAALICRREMLEQVGPFDTGYFMFSEEMDLCRRAGEAGWRVAYVPEAEITHFGGRSTDQAVAGRHIHFNTSKARYFRVHEGRVVGRLVRWYLVGTYVGQLAVEGAKWVVGHKREMRAERVRMYVEVLGSGLRERRSWDRKGGVVLITGEFPPARGGVGDYTCKLAVALEERGVRARVLTRKARGEERDGAGYMSGGMLRVHWAGRVTVGAIRRVMRGSGGRVAHIQYQTGAYDMRPGINFAPLVLRLVGRRPTVVTFHDLLVPYLFPKAGRVRELVNRVMARSAKAVIATNAEDGAQLRGWGVERVEVIPIGSNIRREPPEGFDREEWRGKRGIDVGTVVLAYFGFLSSSKGLDSLLRAVAELEGRVPGRYRLLMVGGGLGSSDPTNRATAQEVDGLARELGVGESIVWTGYLEAREVSAALLAADMAVLPFADGASFRRGSLLAVLEHGLPLITTRKEQDAEGGGWGGEMPRLVDGENTLLVRAGDDGALVDAIERMAGDGELRERLVRGERVLARYFSWESIAERHMLLYNEISDDGALLTTGS